MDGCSKCIRTFRLIRAVERWVAELKRGRTSLEAFLSRLRTADIFYEELFHGRNTLGGLPLPAEWRQLLE